MRKIRVRKCGKTGGYQLVRVIAPPVRLDGDVDAGAALRLERYKDHGAVFQQPVLVKVHGARCGVCVDIRSVVVAVLPGYMDHLSVLREAVDLSADFLHVPERHIAVQIPGVVGVIQNDCRPAIQEPELALVLAVKRHRLREIKAADGVSHAVGYAACVSVVRCHIAAAGGGLPLIDAFPVQRQRVVFQKLYLPGGLVSELAVDRNHIERRRHSAGSRGRDVVVHRPCTGRLEYQQAGMVADQRRNGRVFVSDGRLIQIGEVFRGCNALVQIHAGVYGLVCAVAVQENACVGCTVKELRKPHLRDLCALPVPLAVCDGHGVRALLRGACKCDGALRLVQRPGLVCAFDLDDLVHFLFGQIEHGCAAVRAVFHLPLARQAVHVLQQCAISLRVDCRLNRRDISLNCLKTGFRSAVPAHILMAVQEIYLSAETEEGCLIFRTGPNDSCRRSLQIDIEQNAAKCGNDAIRSTDGTLPCAAEMRVCVRWCRFLTGGPCIPFRSEVQNRFLPRPDLQMLVPRDAEIPHFAQLAGLDMGVSVRVFIQAQKLLDFQDANRCIGRNMGHAQSPP